MHFCSLSKKDMVEVQKRIAEKKRRHNRKIEESSYIDRADGLLGSNIARINSMEELLTVPEREEAERFLSIPLNISVVASAIVDASGYSDRN